MAYAVTLWDEFANPAAGRAEFGGRRRSRGIDLLNRYCRSNPRLRPMTEEEADEYRRPTHGRGVLFIPDPKDPARLFELRVTKRGRIKTAVKGGAV